MSGLATLRDYIRWAMSQFNQAQLFFQQGSDDAFEEARALVLGSLHLPYELHDKYLDCNLHADEHAVLQGVLQKRIEQRTPTAYLLNEVCIAGVLFKVDERVMVPRSPIAELVTQHFSPWLMKTPTRILNLAAGCGYLGIISAMEFPSAQVLLSDISEQALTLADENIALHQLAERVSTVQSDMFTQLPEQRFDLIMCKPPYVDAQQWQRLPQELQYEPRESCLAGNNGLEFIQQVVQQAGQHLTGQGLLILEVGQHRATLVKKYPEVDFVWLEHSHAEIDVLALTAPQCVDISQQFEQALALC